MLWVHLLGDSFHHFFDELSCSSHDLHKYESERMMKEDEVRLAGCQVLVSLVEVETFFFVYFWVVGT